MKTAISIPDDLYEGAERLARRTKKSRSRVATVVCVPMTSNLKWALAPSNVTLPPRLTGLPKESVANVSQIVSVDKDLLTVRVGKLPRSKLELVLSGIDAVLGR
jgi:mRNA interferase MazF